MTKITLLFFISFLALVSCNKQSELGKTFNCKNESFSNLENVKDVKKAFSVTIPKNWKTNLYTSEIQSSIYTADTTKQLTESYLLDFTLVNKKIKLNDNFKLKKEYENLSQNLVKIKSGELFFKEKPTYYTISVGKKKGFYYKVCHFFIKINQENFMIVKAETYGKEQVNDRICKAVSLIEKIQFLE